MLTFTNLHLPFINQTISFSRLNERLKKTKSETFWNGKFKFVKEIRSRSKEPRGPEEIAMFYSIWEGCRSIENIVTLVNAGWQVVGNILLENRVFAQTGIKCWLTCSTVYFTFDISMSIKFHNYWQVTTCQKLKYFMNTDFL